MKILFENEKYKIGIEQYKNIKKGGLVDDKYQYRIDIKTTLRLKANQGCDRDHYTAQSKGLEFARGHADWMVETYFRLPTQKEMTSQANLKSF